MALLRDTYCSYCGTAYESPSGYPRTCPSCKTQVWANPIPVSVVLVPVLHGERTGLLVVRRDIEPRRGKLALVGGFLEEHETWQQGGSREIHEETGVVVDPGTLRTMWFTSTEPRPNRVLLFSVAARFGRGGDALPPFAPNRETSERGLVFGPDGLSEVFAFPLHAEAARRYFAEHEITGPHDFTVA